MSRIAWILILLSNEALAHPGHGTPEPHFHESPAIWMLGAAVLAATLWRLLPALAQIVRQRRSATRSENAAP